MSHPMPDNGKSPGHGSGLRKQGTKQAPGMELSASAEPSPENMRRLVHDLEVRQIELEMQADELRCAQMELEAARTRYFELYQLAPLGYVTVDEAGLILQANLRASALLGMNIGDLINQKITRFISTEDQDTYYLHHKRLLQTTPAQALDLQMRRQDGTPFFAQLTATVVRSAEGTPHCHLVLVDITERKRAEAVQVFLAQSSSASSDEPFFNKLARFLAQSLGMDFVCIDRLEGDGLTARTVAIWCDGHFEDNVTYALKDTPCGDVVGRDVCCFPDGVCRSFPRDRVLEELRAESYVGVTLFGHSGEPIGLIAVISRHPLSNRPQAEATLKTVGLRTAAELQRLDAETALRASNILLSAQQDASTDGILMVDDQARILSYNRRFVELWGLPAKLVEDRADRPVLAFVADQMADREAFLCQVSYLFEHRHETGRDELVLTDGRTIDRYSAPIFGPNKQYYGRVWYFRDITGHRKAEAERERLHAQLAQAHKMECVGRLAGGVAHDFNNMLGAILGNTALILQTLPMGSPERESIVEIEKCGQRSADLTRQLLAFARKETVSPTILDLNATIEDMLKMLRRLIGEDIDLEWAPASALWPVMMDPMQLSQILANLCVNARDAISGRGRINLETRNATIDEAYVSDHPALAPGDYVRIAVTDNGCGMDKEILAQVFEPFFTTKGPGLGTGLGLATVYGVVRQNNGFIHVSSEPAQGTTFTIYLPRQADKAGSTQAVSTPLPAVQGQKTILLVEDEPSLLRIVKRMLVRLGYAVLEASTPGEAIRLAEEHPGQIDLLLTDVVMPEMNGRELTKRLLSSHPGLKRLFMSGYTADVIARHGVLEEGIHFIQKPFTIPDLANKVHAAIGAA